MDKKSNPKVYFPYSCQEARLAILNQQSSISYVENANYNNLCIESVIKPSTYINMSEAVSLQKINIDSTLERVAQWFLFKASMSNKKLQKLCYYAYCWFFVFFNDVETITQDNVGEINVLCSDRFQAWIHGPVSLKLYHRYKDYGWHDIPRVETQPEISCEIITLLEQVWEAYGHFSADELERISHRETPWQNARRGYQPGDACSNEISDYDILQYYSNLG